MGDTMTSPGLATMNEPIVGDTMTSPDKSKMADGDHIEFHKMLVSSCTVPY